MQSEGKRKTLVDGLQHLIVAIPGYFPVPVPDAALLLVNACDAGSRAVGAFGVIKLFVIQIAERKMSQIQIPKIPSFLFSGIAAHTLAEKRQFESEPMPIVRRNVSCVIPPFRLKLGMIEIIARKLVWVARDSNLIRALGSQRAHPNQQQEQ